MAERQIEIVISAADHYSRTLAGLDADLKRAESSISAATRVSTQFTRELSNLTDASDWAAGGVRQFKNVLENIAFGGTIGAVSAVTEVFINYAREAFATQEQIDKLNNSVMAQAKAWKLLPEPIGAVSAATIELYNAELRYLQFQERDRGDGLERHVKALEQVKRTMGENPEWAGYFGNSIEQIDIKLSKAKVALEDWQRLMELTPTTAAKVAESLKPVKIGMTAAYESFGDPAFISDSIRMTEEGLKADPPSLTIPLSLNWTMASDVTDMENGVSEKLAMLAEAERLMAQERLDNLKSPYGGGFTRTDQFSSAYNEYDNKLRELETYNATKLQLMQQAGADELAIEAAHAELSNTYAAARRDFQLNTASQTLGGMSNFMQNLYVATGSRNKAMFQMMKAFAISEATINTAKAATKALDAPPGPPWSFAYVAATVAAGAAQIATIASSEPGSRQTLSATGHASPGYAGGSPTAYPVPTRFEPEAKPSQQITLQVYALDPSSVNWDKMMEDNIKPALERLSGDRNVSLAIRVAPR